MGKSRFTTADVAAQAACLRARGLVGMRATNIYDASEGKGVLLRLSRSGDDGEKVGVLLEAGVRFHTVPDDPTDRGKGDGGGASSAAAPPSGLVMKLRKHLRSRRLEAVTQLGCDRLVDFTFGSGEGTHHLLLELHSHGNIVLADGAWNVLTLLRSHVDAGRGLAILPAKPYPLAACVRPRRRVGAADLEEAIAAKSGRSGGAPVKAVTLKAVLAAAMPHGPAVAESVALAAGLVPGRVVAGGGGGPAAASSPPAEPLTAAEIDALVTAAGEVEDWIDRCEATVGEGGGGGGGEAAAAASPPPPPPPAGAIILARPAGATTAQPPDDAASTTTPAAAPVSYESFEALPLAQHAGRPSLPFSTFDDAVREYFGAIAGQRAAASQAAAEAAAIARVDRIKADQARRAGELAVEAEAAAAAAAALEANLAAADEVIAALRAALARGTAWADLERLIADEAAAGNPVAGRVRGLKLAAGRATIALPRTPSSEDDDDDEGGKKQQEEEFLVEVDLALGAHANARALYDARRARLTKHARTVAGHEAALAAASARAAATVASVRAAAVARAAARAFKPLWFQRFDWFITTEGFLVLAGRDAAQNEALVRRHLRPGDAFVHADTHGAAAVILKNRRSRGVPLPLLSLAEAGAACVCRSSAWAAKVAAGAWWVEAHQVSKAAPSGESLPTGSFVVRGKKRALPPGVRLELGFTYLFRLDEEGAAAHAGERAVRGEEEEEDGREEGAGGAAATAGSAVREAPSSSSSPPAPGANGGGDEDGNDGGRGDEEHDGESAGGDDDDSESNGADLDAALAAPDPLAPPGSVRPTAVPGIDAAPGEEEEEEDEGGGGTGAAASPTSPSEPPPPPALGRRRPTAAERRAMKKLGVTDLSDLPAGAVPASRAEPPPPTPAGPPGEPRPTATQPPPPPAPRGKRAKAKRAKDRYAHQSDEERALAVAALGAPGGAAKTRAQKRADRKARAGGSGGQAGGRASDALAAAPPTAEELAAVGALGQVVRPPGGGKKAGAAAPVRTPGKGLAGAVAALHLEDEEETPGGGGVDDDSNGSASEGEAAGAAADSPYAVLATLTASPRPGDTLLQAIPMVAPYAALAGAALRVKLTPGTGKRGRVAKAAAALLARAPGVSPRMRELMRAVPDVEAAAVVPGGGTKVVAPGAAKLAAEARKGKKKGKGGG